MNETIRFALVCMTIVGIFLAMSSCITRISDESEKTKQEAIKAGLVQGEYGRWEKKP